MALPPPCPPVNVLARILGDTVSVYGPLREGEGRQVSGQISALRYGYEIQLEPAKARDLAVALVRAADAVEEENENMYAKGPLEVSDAEAGAVQKTPHRVTLDAMKAKIAATYWIAPFDAVRSNAGAAYDALKPLTLCIIVTRSGFTLVGKSAPADPANYDKALGEKLAYEDALRQMWPLEGYLLREQLHLEQHLVPGG